jgi:hypothetical protein
MKGAEIGLDSESETCAQDTSGKVYLSRKEPVDEWERYLRTLNWANIHESREKVQKAKHDVCHSRYPFGVYLILNIKLWRLS